MPVTTRTPKKRERNTEVREPNKRDTLNEKQNFTYRMSLEKHLALAKKAEEAQVPMSVIVNRAVDLFLDLGDVGIQTRIIDAKFKQTEKDIKLIKQCLRLLVQNETKKQVLESA
jgi:methyl coenzyme M reductase subunit C